MAESADGPPEPRRALEPGRVLNNNYRIIERIGEGGMGAVWLAENIFMEEDHVAIKVIRTEQADDEVFRQMFGKEVKAMLRLNNPHLVAYRTFAHDPELDLSFIVTEYIDGPDLKSLIGKRTFTPTELLSLLTELAIGLRAAHNVGIVHRDIAPDNVLLEEGDIARPKIIDFGIVKDTAADTTIIGSGFAGKYGFVAPEQLGEPDYPIGPWTDIYSLALVILCLASGKRIDMGNTPGSAIRQRREVPDLAPIAAPMRPLMADMLAYHPDDRLRSADEVLSRAEPIFAQLAALVDDDLLPTIITPTPAAPMGVMGGAFAEGSEEEDEITQVVIGTSALETAQVADEEEEYEEEYEEEEPKRGGARIGWIVFGLVFAVGLAIAGGMALGQFASPFADDENGDDPAPSPTAYASEPAPLPTETVPPIDLPAALPAIAIATSVAPDSGVVPINPESWVQQEDLPRQLFRDEQVLGIIAAYVTVVPNGTVSRCTVGSSSEVEPTEMLRPSAVGVCRALSERARFQPFGGPEPGYDLGYEQQAAEAVGQEVKEPIEPQSREVFVRVAFRTAGPAIP